MTRILLTVILSFITACAFPIETQTNDTLQCDESSYILIISSYPYEESWSTTIAKSIRAKLEQDAPETTIHIAYADIGNRNSFLSERFAIQKTFTFSKDRTEILIPSIIVLIGEESWMVYRIMNHKGIWDKIPVVLCGAPSHIMKDYTAYFESKTIKDSLMIPIEESQGQPPVTAIIKEDNELATINIMRNLFPSLKEIIFISTGNYQDKYALLKLEKAIATYHPQIKLHIWHNDKKNNNQIEEQISSLSSGTAILTNSYIFPDNLSHDIPIFTLIDRQPKGQYIIGGVYPLIDDYATETANTVLELCNQASIGHLPFKYTTNTINLNKEAIRHFNIDKKANKIPNVVYTNIPATFLFQHYRTIALIVLVIIVFIFFVKLSKRIRNHQKQVVQSLDQYKKLYEEYMAVYENMPMGMLIFDYEGNLSSSNPNSVFFIDLLSTNDSPFHLFNNTIINKEMKDNIRKGKNINRIIKVRGYYLRFIIKTRLNVKNEQEYFILILDNTDIQRAKEEKESIYDIFNYAMNASSIGVAEYNRVTNTGIATDAWFDTFFSERTTEFSNVHQYVVEEDQKKVLDFFNQIGSGNKNTFSDILRVVKDNETHWIRVLIQLIKYDPLKNEIIFTELATNIDKQKEREKEFAIALKKAKESDRLKNSFVNNMSIEISSHIEEIVNLSTQLHQTSSFHERVELLSHVHKHNDILLEHITEIINSSKEEPGY